MIRQIVFLLLLVPTIGIAETLSKDNLVGDWEWLGNAFTQSTDTKNLTRTGPSIKRFFKDGRYEYTRDH